jgi:hypothetical protein
MKAAMPVIVLALLSGCATSPPVSAVRPDPTKEPWYDQTVQELAAMVREAEADFAQGKRDDAAALIVKAEPLVGRLLAVSQPTVAAAEAASDLDDLYGRMLLTNRHYGEARLFFQKNLSRWKHWQPQTPETARRFEQATAAIAECDRHIVE